MATLYATPTGFVNHDTGQAQEPESGDTIIIHGVNYWGANTAPGTLFVADEFPRVVPALEEFDPDDFAEKLECDERERPAFPVPEDEEWDWYWFDAPPVREKPAADHRYARPP